MVTTRVGPRYGYLVGLALTNAHSILFDHYLKKYPTLVDRLQKLIRLREDMLYGASERAAKSDLFFRIYEQHIRTSVNDRKKFKKEKGGGATNLKYLETLVSEVSYVCGKLEADLNRGQEETGRIEIKS
jgi:hypothetical protein